MTTHVTDVPSNPNEQIHHAAKVLERSEKLRVLFAEIYRGKRVTKGVTFLAKTTRMTKVRVLQLGLKLAQNGLVKKYRLDGETVYEKDPFLAGRKQEVLRYAERRELRSKLPTKQEPRVRFVGGAIAIHIPRAQVRVRHVTIDEIQSFARVRGIRARKAEVGALESRVKAGFQKLIGERGSFKDWGGERADLFTTRVTIGSRRVRGAFAFKGRGTTGKLVPAKLGKNGDQIQRLFKVTADVYFVQYGGQIEESVEDLMHTAAVAASFARGGDLVRYGTIDGADSERLMIAYPAAFKLRGIRSAGDSKE